MCNGLLVWASPSRLDGMDAWEEIATAPVPNAPQPKRNLDGTKGPVDTPWPGALVTARTHPMASKWGVGKTWQLAQTTKTNHRRNVEEMQEC